MVARDGEHKYYKHLRNPIVIILFTLCSLDVVLYVDTDHSKQ